MRDSQPLASRAMESAFAPDVQAKRPLLGGASTMADTWVLLTLALLLGATLLVGHRLRRLKVQWIGDAGAALVLGVVVGWAIKAAGAGPDFASLVSFNPDLFVLVLLPTIMFDAGFSLAPKPFLRNLGSVIAFAFAGTAISTFAVGLLMWGFGAAGWCTQLGFLFNLIFGSIISATDPVTVLAVFNKLNADEDLYMNVLGESVLNDAVAMVLYETLQKFVGVQVTMTGIWAGIGSFVAIFVGSVALGVAIGLASALLFRMRRLQHDDPLIETGLVVVIAYVSYLGAQAVYLSGICSVVFCGMTMRSYVVPSLSHHSFERVEALFKTLGGLFEIFVYVYIGLTLFLESQKFFIPRYLVFTLLALAVSRAANVYPLTALVNYLRLPSHRISWPAQFVMWWSGLRGAMAFALAIDAEEQYGDAGRRMKTCTFYVIGLTVLVNGGSVGYMLEHWDLKKKPALPTASSSSPLLDGGGDDGDASVDDDAPRKRGVGGSPAGASAMSQGADGEAVLVVRASVVALAGGELDGGLSPTRKAGLPTVAEGSGPAAVGGGPPPALARLSSLSRASLSRTSGAGVLLRAPSLSRASGSGVLLRAPSLSRTSGSGAGSAALLRAPSITRTAGSGSSALLRAPSMTRTSSGAGGSRAAARAQASRNTTMPMQRARSALQLLREFSSQHFEEQMMRLGDQLGQRILSPASSAGPPRQRSVSVSGAGPSAISSSRGGSGALRRAGTSSTTTVLEEDEEAAGTSP